MHEAEKKILENYRFIHKLKTEKNGSRRESGIQGSSYPDKMKITWIQDTSEKRQDFLINMGWEEKAPIKEQRNGKNKPKTKISIGDLKNKNGWANS